MNKRAEHYKKRVEDMHKDYGRMCWYICSSVSFSQPSVEEQVSKDVFEVLQVSLDIQ